jgi:hypothetical protein
MQKSRMSMTRGRESSSMFNGFIKQLGMEVFLRIVFRKGQVEKNVWILDVW